MSKQSVNPNTLKGIDQTNRMKELMGKIAPLVESTKSLAVLELAKLGPDNIVYGVVRENKKYFIKKTDKLITETITVSDFDYSGGLKNKLEESYPTYEKAIKQLNLKFISLNEDHKKNYVNVFKNDLNEDVKYKLKLPNTGGNDYDEEQVNPQPTTNNSNDSQMGQNGDQGGNDKPFDDTPFNAGVEADENQDPKKYIQQLAGKLGQSLRTYYDNNGMDGELEKFCINSLISALHTNEMSDEDINDIINKLNQNDDGNDENSNNDNQEAPAQEAPADGGEQLGENEFKAERKSPFVDPTLTEDFGNNEGGSEMYLIWTTKEGVNEYQAFGNMNQVRQAIKKIDDTWDFYNDRQHASSEFKRREEMSPEHRIKTFFPQERQNVSPAQEAPVQEDAPTADINVSVDQAIDAILEKMLSKLTDINDVVPSQEPKGISPEATPQGGIVEPNKEMDTLLRAETETAPATKPATEAPTRVSPWRITPAAEPQPKAVR